LIQAKSTETVDAGKSPSIKSCDPPLIDEWFKLDGDSSDDEQSASEETTVLLCNIQNGINETTLQCSETTTSFDSMYKNDV